MRPLLACPHFHEQSNTATVVLVALAEWGLAPLHPDRPGPELVLHGLLQRGPYREGGGQLPAAAVRHMASHGVRCQWLHDTARTAALRERICGERPEFVFTLTDDLGGPPHRPAALDQDLGEDNAIILVEARHGTGRLPLHLLLLRRDADGFQVMNSDTGLNHACTAEQVAAHLNTPVGFGAGAFAGGMYLYTGLAIRLSR